MLISFEIRKLSPPQSALLACFDSRSGLLFREILSSQSVYQAREKQIKDFSSIGVVKESTYAYTKNVSAFNMAGGRDNHYVTTREDPGNKVDNMAPGKSHVNSRTSKKFLQGNTKSSSGVKKSNTSKMCKKKV